MWHGVGRREWGYVCAPSLLLISVSAWPLGAQCNQMLAGLCSGRSDLKIKSVGPEQSIL